MAAACYNRDASENSLTYPCPVTGPDGFAACCQAGHACLSNGLCAIAFDGSFDLSHLFRRSCTDASWESDSCPQVCLDDASPTVSVESCSEGSPIYHCLDIDNLAASREVCNGGQGDLYDYSELFTALCDV